MEKRSNDKLFFHGIKYLSDGSFPAMSLRLNFPGYLDGGNGLRNDVPWDELHERMLDWRKQANRLIGEQALAARAVDDAKKLLEGLRAQEDIVARRAVEAFADPDVDNNRVERQRDELDVKLPTLEERGKRCEDRALLIFAGADDEGEAEAPSH